MKTGLILGYVPVEVKTQEFYYGMLDGMKILSTVTDAVVPSRFKTAAYYRKMRNMTSRLFPPGSIPHEILHAGCLFDRTEKRLHHRPPVFQALRYIWTT